MSRASERANAAVCTLGLTRANVSASIVALERVGIGEARGFDACLCSFSISFFSLCVFEFRLLFRFVHLRVFSVRVVLIRVREKERPKPLSR